MLQDYGSWKNWFQIVLLLVMQLFLMCCHVICSSGLKIASLNTSVNWDSVLSVPCPMSGLRCRGTGTFLLPPQARLKLQQWSSTCSQRKVVRDVLLYLEDDLSRYGSMFWLALSLQEHCSFFSTSLYKFWLQLFCQSYLEISFWVKKGI